MMVTRRLYYDAVKGYHQMAEQREEDRVTDNIEDDMRKEQAQAYAAWLQADGKRIRDEERIENVKDLIFVLIIAPVLCALLFVVLAVLR